MPLHMQSVPGSAYTNPYYRVPQSSMAPTLSNVMEYQPRANHQLVMHTY